MWRRHLVKGNNKEWHGSWKLLASEPRVWLCPLCRGQAAPCPASAWGLASFTARDGQKEAASCAQRLMRLRLLLSGAKPVLHAGDQHARSQDCGGRRVKGAWRIGDAVLDHTRSRSVPISANAPRQLRGSSLAKCADFTLASQTQSRGFSFYWAYSARTGILRWNI